MMTFFCDDGNEVMIKHTWTIHLTLTISSVSYLYKLMEIYYINIWGLAVNI